MTTTEISVQDILNLTVPHTVKGFDSISNTDISLIENGAINLYLTIRCFVNIEYPKHSINDIPIKVRKQLKIHAAHLHSLYLLCINTHGRQIISTIPEYKSGSEWFLLILKELFNNIVDETSDRFQIPAIYKGDKKRWLISIFSNEITLISKLQNPYSEKKSLTHLAYLMDCAFERAEQSEKFRRDYLIPVVKSGRNWIKALNSSVYERIDIDKNNKIYTIRSNSKSKKYHARKNGL